MMLDLTPKEITERKSLKINPNKTCQPVGAMYAALVYITVCLTAMDLKDAAHIIEHS